MRLASAPGLIFLSLTYQVTMSHLHEPVGLLHSAVHERGGGAEIMSFVKRSDEEISRHDHGLMNREHSSTTYYSG